MAAKVYEILESVQGDLYFAKKTKRKRHMSEDRRKITDDEICAMAHWYLEKELKRIKSENPNASDTLVITDGDGNMLYIIYTWRNMNLRKIFVSFYPMTSLMNRVEIYNHEKRHIEDRIMEWAGVDDIESAGLLAGFLGTKFYNFEQIL